jgi:hypothetical protein
MEKIMKNFIIFTLLTVFAVSANAAESKTKEFNIVIKDHVFVPSETVIPADTKVKLIIDNQDATPEEFESHDLRREKIIQGKSKGIILVGPLKAGEYSFVGEFNEDTAKGTLKVK